MSLGNVSASSCSVWADGSNWNKVIESPEGSGHQCDRGSLAAKSLSDDVAALDRTLERIKGPLVLAGYAYVGADQPRHTASHGTSDER
jgi:hypothetical protein